MDTGIDTDHLGPDLRAQLDAAIGDGPSHRPLDERLAAGRRALLRRRVGTALAAATVVAVAGTAYAAATDGGERAGNAPGYASSPTTSSAAPSAPAGGVPPVLAYGGDDGTVEGAVRLEGDALVAREGFRILEQRTGVDLGASRGRTAVALVDGEDGRMWWLAWAADGDLHYSFQPAQPGETMAGVIAAARDAEGVPDGGAGGTG